MAGWASCAPPEALDDPIAERIEKGSIVVEAVAFVRAPQTDDPGAPTIHERRARAPLQSLQPIPDGSGRLALSDLRGAAVSYGRGRPQAPRLYLDLRGHPVDFYNDAFPNESGLLGFAFHPQFGEEGAPGYGKLYTAFSAGPDSGVADYLDESGANQESVIYEWSARERGRRRIRLAVGANSSGSGSSGGGTTSAASASTPMPTRVRPTMGCCMRDLATAAAGTTPTTMVRTRGRRWGPSSASTPLGGRAGAAVWHPGRQPRLPPGKAGFLRSGRMGFVIHEHFSWDVDGRMYLVDIGQDQVEEINIGVAGGNYGWRLREGNVRQLHSARAGERRGAVYPRPLVERPFIYPVAQYDHDEGLAVGSGFVYRGGTDSGAAGQVHICGYRARARILHRDGGSGGGASGADSGSSHPFRR